MCFFQNVYCFCGFSSPNYCFEFTAMQFFFFLVPVRNCWGWALALETWGTTFHLPAPTKAGAAQGPAIPAVMSFPRGGLPILVRMEKKAVYPLKREPADFLMLLVKEEVKTKRRYDKGKDWFKGVQLGQGYPTRNFPGYNPRGAYSCLSPGLN